MRRWEIKSARWEDIDRDKMILRISRTKTNTPRTIPIRGVLHDILDQLGWEEKGPIFPSCKIFCSSGFQALEKRAGIEHKPGRAFHKLRSSGASHMIALGIDYHVVARLGGWKNLGILQRHYDKLGRATTDQVAAIERLGELLQILCRSEEALQEAVNLQLPVLPQNFPS